MFTPAWRSICTSRGSPPADEVTSRMNWRMSSRLSGPSTSICCQSFGLRTACSARSIPNRLVATTNTPSGRLSGSPSGSPRPPSGSGSASSSPSTTTTIGSRCCSSGCCWSRLRAAASSSRLNQSGRDAATGSTPSGAHSASRSHAAISCAAKFLRAASGERPPGSRVKWHGHRRVPARCAAKVDFPTPASAWMITYPRGRPVMNASILRISHSRPVNRARSRSRVRGAGSRYTSRSRSNPPENKYCVTGAK
jgi:hypothetical protein